MLSARLEPLTGIFRPPLPNPRIGTVTPVQTMEVIMTSDSRDQEQDAQGKDSSKTEPEGSIPNTDDGVGATATEEPSSFEPEEDPDEES